jgi:hypothetical protein
MERRANNLCFRIWLVVLAVFSAQVTFAADRVALLIGNSRYDNAALSLRNPANDVAAMSQKLGSLGFVVITAQDASSADMLRALNAFEKQLAGAEMGLFFYAGHGSQASGENFLLATDFQGNSSDAVKAASLTLGKGRAAFAQAKPLAGVIILDACRDNPLAVQLDPTGKSNGLARSRSTPGVLIAYATDPGNVAFEGTGDNSIFTTALLKHISEPGLDVRLMFGRVRQDVVLRTRGAQVPWVEESLIGEYTMNPSLDSGGREAMIARDIQMWRDVSSKSTVQPYNDYLAAFPDGMFKDFANQRVSRLSYAANLPASTDPVVLASLDVTKDTDRISAALNILGFTPSSRSAVDIDELQAAAAAYRASLGDNAALTADNLFADASRLLLYLGGNVGKQIQIDIAALSSIDQTLIVATDAYNELEEIAKGDANAKPILEQAKLDIAAIQRAQTEVLGQLDQERGYYEDLMAQANTNFSQYMVERTIGAAATRSAPTDDEKQVDRAKLFLKHVNLAANAETQGTYQWLSDFLPRS